MAETPVVEPTAVKPPQEVHTAQPIPVPTPQIDVQVTNVGQGTVVIHVPPSGPGSMSIDVAPGASFTVSVGDAGFSVGPRK